MTNHDKNLLRPVPRDTERRLAEIAKTHLRIETLDERGCDALDFHDVGVASLKDALVAAFHLGEEHGRRRRS